MANELLTILEYIERERGISRQNLIKALESAILVASRKSLHPASDLRVQIDPKTGQIRAWARLEVVTANPNNDQLILARAKERYPEVKPGEIVDWEVTPSNFGRIAAQTARQAIVQQLRRAEKENVAEEYADRVGQILNGTVKRIEPSGIIIDFQKADGIMAGRDRVRDEQYFIGDRINALLVKVDMEGSGPSLIVSRTSPDFVVKLFEREVSEIRDGLVKIMGIAREAGQRTKIAVASSDPRVDPVGSCVGVRGSRVRNITEELENERIDIIPYSDDIKKYAANALLPAKIESVSADYEHKELTVTVSAEQSRIAFGRKAQNIRLAAKLLNWKITLNSLETPAEPTLQEKMHQAAEQLARELNVSTATADTLVANGFVTIDGVKAADRETLLSIPDLDPEELAGIIAQLGK